MRGYRDVIVVLDGPGGVRQVIVAGVLFERLPTDYQTPTINDGVNMIVELDVNVAPITGSAELINALKGDKGDSGDGLEEIYVGSTTPTSPSIKLWIDTTEVVVNHDVEILRAIRDANPQSTELAALFDDSKDPLTEWYDADNYLGALFGGHPDFATIYEDSTGETAPTNVDEDRCYLLSCYSNQLTSLDATGLTALQYLYCGNNQLTSLDATVLTALQYLYCDSNQLTSIPSLTSKGLITQYNFTYNYMPTTETDRLIALGFDSQYVLPQNTPIN
jgi:Leucine-rich repeat (LRR) protein